MQVFEFLFYLIFFCCSAYYANINQRYDYINQSEAFCNIIQFSEIDVISTPISFLLIIMYILIYKRRVFLRNKFKYRNIGLPMIVSVWNKVNNFIFLKMIKFK